MPPLIWTISVQIYWRHQKYFLLYSSQFFEKSCHSLYTCAIACNCTCTHVWYVLISTSNFHTDALIKNEMLQNQTYCLSKGLVQAALFWRGWETKYVDFHHECCQVQIWIISGGKIIGKIQEEEVRGGPGGTIWGGDLHDLEISLSSSTFNTSVMRSNEILDPLQFKTV